MKVSKEEYKKYAFPYGILIGFIITYIIAVSVMLVLGKNIIEADYGLGLLNALPRIVLVIVVAIVLLFALSIFPFFTKKIYRGIGLYVFINIITALTVVAAVALMIIYGKTEKPLTFMEFLLLFVTCSLVFALRFIKYGVIYRKCSCCGLVNTLSKSNTEEQKLSTTYDFYVEHGKGLQAGVYEKTKRTTKYLCSVCGGENVDVDEYDKRV